MQQPLTFANALAQIIDSLSAEQPLHIRQAVDMLQRTAPKLIDACKHAWVLAYVLGDRDTQQSRDLFNLHMLCDDALYDTGED